MMAETFDRRQIRKLLLESETFGEEFFRLVRLGSIMQLAEAASLYSGKSPEQITIAKESAFENRKYLCKRLFALNDKDEYKALCDEGAHPIFAAFIRNARESDEVRADICEDFFCLILEGRYTTYEDFLMENRTAT